jgi:UDP-N-acetyl-alpha-D-muramoyl-L-alanyl-L-glutamate epimerase
MGIDEAVVTDRVLDLAKRVADAFADAAAAPDVVALGRELPAHLVDLVADRGGRCHDLSCRRAALHDSGFRQLAGLRALTCSAGCGVYCGVDAADDASREKPISRSQCDSTSRERGRVPQECLVSTPAAFRYDSYELDPDRGVLACRYSHGSRRFEERVTFGASGRWDSAAVVAAARLVFLLAGVSYYKTAAPPVIDLGQTAVTDAERDFLHAFYVDGLGEYAYRNDLDLSGLRIEGPARTDSATGQPPPDWREPGRPLVPFGGGIDSIVTTELVRRRAEPALFIVSRPGDLFDAIERPAAVTGLPIVRAAREIDSQLLRSAEFGFLNGHVPVTGILSAIAVMAAALQGRDAVVMSNEWSASIPTLEVGGQAINHQYSKSVAFEAAFRRVLADSFGGRLSYFSALRPFSELWVAQRFARLTDYHGTFRSCNHAFHIDKSRRLEHWCGRCDKCCFIDLILAPFLSPAELGRIFTGREPLTDPDPSASLADRFRTLIGTSAHSKPFECVGEIGECRAAMLLAAQRPDRAENKLLQELAGELSDQPELPAAADLLQPIGAHFIPDAYAAEDLLV